MAAADGLEADDGVTAGVDAEDGVEAKSMTYVVPVGSDMDLEQHYRITALSVFAINIDHACACQCSLH